MQFVSATSSKTTYYQESSTCYYWVFVFSTYTRYRITAPFYLYSINACLQQKYRYFTVDRRLLGRTPLCYRSALSPKKKRLKIQ